MIRTWSKFYTGVDISNTNSWVDFDEGDGPLSFQLEFGNYTLVEAAIALQSGFNSVGTQTYSVNGDYVNRTLVISAEDPFDLLAASGPNNGFTAYPTLGLTRNVDRVGENSYGDGEFAEEYRPQFLLQSYVPFELFVESTDATKNKSADGRTEIVQFGRERKCEIDLKFITNLPMDGTFIRNNPVGLGDALRFLDYISQGKKFDFIPDEDTPSFSYKCILESIPGFGNGTGFKLKELFAQGLPDIYETGVFTIRELN